MFEGMTYEVVLEDMLSRVISDIDKREGSVIYDSLAPAAYKVAENYYYLDQFLNLIFGDTAVDTFLDRVVADHGMTRKQSTYAIRKVTTSGAVNIGTRWGIEDLVYDITALVSSNVYAATCETLGSIGNTYSGALENIDNVSGITATLTDIMTSGEDEETDDNLRTRFYLQVRSTGTSGNACDYRNWALEVPGCGDAKVFPLWNGAGTVKVLVVDENMTINATLPTTVHDYIETVRPIGATVTVASPTSLSINITANVMLNGTKTLAEVRTAFTTSLTSYLRETVFEVYSVSYAKIGSLLLATAGVDDYSALLVNAGTANITISSGQMPIVGTLTLTEVV